MNRMVFMDAEKSRGQVALMIALIMVVAGTITLSVVGGAISELRVESVEEESSQALRAAEAGVEEALRNLNLQGANLGEFGSASYTTSAESQGTNGFLSDLDLEEGGVIEVWLEGAPSLPTSIDVYWGDRGDGTEQPIGAVEVIKYQRFAADDYRAVHYTFDPDAARSGINNFAAAVVNPGSFKGVSFGAKANVPIVLGDILLRVKVFYNSAKIGVAPLPGSSALPAQQYRIVSTGQTTGGVTRKVEVTRTNLVLPAMFDAALYSGGSLSQ